MEINSADFDLAHHFDHGQIGEMLNQAFISGVCEADPLLKKMHQALSDYWDSASKREEHDKSWALSKVSTAGDLEEKMQDAVRQGVSESFDAVEAILNEEIASVERAKCAAGRTRTDDDELDPKHVLEAVLERVEQTLGTLIAPDFQLPLGYGAKVEESTRRKQKSPSSVVEKADDTPVNSGAKHQRSVRDYLQSVGGKATKKAVMAHLASLSEIKNGKYAVVGRMITAGLIVDVGDEMVALSD